MPCAKKMRGCHRACRHRERIEDYYRARDDQEARAEAATHGYETEIKAYFDAHDGVEQRVVLKNWLIETANPEESAA